MDTINEILNLLQAYGRNSTALETKYRTFIIPIQEYLNIHFIPLKSENSTLYQSHSFTHKLTTDFGEDDISVIHVWEDQWINKREIITSRISSILNGSTKIHGRETVAKKIPLDVARDFLNKHHLQGATSAKHKFGLFKKDELVSVITLGPKVVFNDLRHSYEIIRYCTLSGHTVVGGLSKFIKFIRDDIDPDHLMTYIDRDWSTGKAFKQIGFEQEEITPPVPYFLDIHNSKRYFKHEVSDANQNLIKIYNSGSYKLTWAKRHQ